MSNGILNEQEIVDSSFSVDGFSGVYFLVAQGKVVYVGQSTNIFSRLQSHSANKKFDSIKIITCHRLKLNSLESVYIHSLRPKLNAKHGDGCMVAPLSFANALKMEDSVPTELLIEDSPARKDAPEKLAAINVFCKNLQKLKLLFNPVFLMVFLMVLLTSIFAASQYYIFKNHISNGVAGMAITFYLLSVLYFCQDRTAKLLSE